MANTIPLLSWQLEQSCRFRPKVSTSRLSELAADLRLLEKEAAVDGYESFRRVGSVRFEYRGHAWELALAKSLCFDELGSAAEFKSVCQQCPAGFHQPSGCTGYIAESDLDESLARLVERRGLTTQAAEINQAEHSLWHTLWGSSPLPEAHLKFLAALFAESESEPLRAFHKAVEIAIWTGKPLNVSLSPPVSVDVDATTQQQEIPNFQRAWLQREGIPENEAEEIVAAHLSRRAETNRAKAVNEFLSRSLFANITPLGADASDCHPASIWDKQEALTILQRATEQNIPITEMAWVPEEGAERVQRSRDSKGIADPKGEWKRLRPLRGEHRYRFTFHISPQKCGHTLPQYKASQ